MTEKNYANILGNWIELGENERINATPVELWLNNLKSEIPEFVVVRYQNAEYILHRSLIVRARFD